MPVTTIASFWAVSFLFVMTPGADWAYAITAGLRHRSVFPAVGGLLAGHVLATLLVAAGVGALLVGSSGAVGMITVIGAAYLVWLGGRMAVSRATEPIAGWDDGVQSWSRQAATGFGVSGLNPKVFLLFLALLPQFVDNQRGWPIPAQIATLGLVHVISCAVIYTVVGLSARAVLRTRPLAALVVTRVSGALLVVIGLWLLAKQLHGMA